MRVISCMGLLLFSILWAGDFQHFALDIESGVTFLSYSDVQIPKSTGTLISFSDELETDMTFFIRGRFTYYLDRGNMLSVLYAPLTLNAAGSVDRDVVFEGETFTANTALSTVYKFNSYRLTYEHFWFIGERLRLGLGATAKVRDAKISIADSVKVSEKTDLGFVPLIKFSVVWKFIPPLSLVLDGDALAAPQGRAEDISLAVQGDASPNLSLKLGYRVLEGGSDIEEVYSFTWINYLFAGATLRF